MNLNVAFLLAGLVARFFLLLGIRIPLYRYAAKCYILLVTVSVTVYCVQKELIAPYGL